MASVFDILERYGKLVPFPITPAKISKAGYEPGFYLSRLLNDLRQCSDADRPEVKRVIKRMDAQFALC